MVLQLMTRGCNSNSSGYCLGLVFIGLVAVIWAASSILLQYIYKSDTYQFNSPFLVTYIGVSLFTLWLPIHQCLNHVLPFFVGTRNSNTDEAPGSTSYETIPIHEEEGEMQQHQEPPSSERQNGELNNHIQESSDHLNGNNNADPHHAETTTSGSSDDDDNSSALSSSSSSSSTITTAGVQYWTDRDHRNAAMKIAPVWFVANWTYNASLEYTSITSSTVLASTGSLFTFLFAVALRDENFGFLKLSGVCLGVLGSFLTAWNDHDDDENGNNGSNNSENDPNNNNSDETHVWGDLLGLLSAIGYGAYAVQTRVLCPKSEALYSMQVLLGYIGLFNMVLLFPIAAWQYTKLTTTNVLVVIGFLVVKGLFDNALSDYLWLRAVMLTNATVATVGLGLTIPLAFLSDVFWTADNNNNGDSSNHNGVLSNLQIMGALSVLAGFVLVNVGNQEQEDQSGSDMDRQVRNVELRQTEVVDLSRLDRV